MDDLEDVCARVMDSEVTRFTGGILTSEEAKDLLLKRIARQSTTSHFGNRAIELKETKRNIGYCGLNDLPLAGEGRIEVSYGLNRSYWGKGFATEAASAMIQFGFETPSWTKSLPLFIRVMSHRLELICKLEWGLRQKILAEAKAARLEHP